MGAGGRWRGVEVAGVTRLDWVIVACAVAFAVLVYLLITEVMLKT